MFQSDGGLLSIDCESPTGGTKQKHHDLHDVIVMKVFEKCIRHMNTGMQGRKHDTW